MQTMPKSLVVHGRPVSACERCRKAKVGCDRARPRCGRCSRTGAACEYETPSKRTEHVSSRERLSRCCDPTSHSASSVGSEAHTSPATTGSVDHTSPDNALSNGMPTAERSACHRDPTPTDSALALEEAHSPSGSKPCRVKLKRDRAILSCVRCRKHKVRCDRRIPCGRCIKTRREAQCVYSEPAHAPPKPVVWDGDAALNTIATRFVDATWDAQNRNGTHWNNLLQELKAYLPRDHGARTDFNIHRESLPQPLTMSINYPFSNDASSPEAVQRIVNQLPPRALQDIFISQYADTVERAYHLLDEKAWRQELEQFWLNDNSMPADWLALHLMILSLGCQAHNFVAQATGEGEAYDSLPTRFMHSAEVCLKRTPYMLRPTLANIRTLCLIVISKQIYAMSCHESDTCWPLTGLIKRLCMRIGLHVPIQVDPDSLGARNDNMARRKLWAVVVFLDMRQSLVCGMPVLLRPQDLACFREPSQRGNALSREEHRHSEQDTTSNSWLENIFSTSGDLLLQALDAANSADGPVTYDQVAELDAALRQQLKCSGMGLATANLGTEGCPGPIDLEACTVHLFFRLVLMALHSRFALSSSATADHPISCVSSLESALATLSHQRTLCEDVGWERQRRGRGRGRQSAWFAGLLKHEFFTAAMTVCSQLVRTGGDGMALGLPSSCSCEGRPREIVLEALQSCRDVWSRDKDASICNANAFAVVDNLVCILRDSQQSA